MANRSQTPKSVGLQQESDIIARGRAPTSRDPRQPQLPFDPMPDRIEPCLALLAAKPPAGPEWAYEIKWDGYRLAVHVDDGHARILTRGGHDWSHRFPAIARAAVALDAPALILDGEAVVLDDQGRSDFAALQQALGGRGGKRVAGDEVIFYAFDMLYFDGHDITRMALVERRHLLEDLLRDETGTIRLSEEVQAEGADLLRIACQHGLEGIIAKNREAPYRSGRRGDWLKIKCIQSDSFVVFGYEPSSKVRGAIASLLLAAQSEKGLVYVGSVGTGFKGDQVRELRQQLDAMKTERPPYAPRERKLVIARPELVAEIEYRGWTGDRKLRHASFKRLRETADSADVFRLSSPPGNSAEQCSEGGDISVRRAIPAVQSKN
ncbi:non-homologous end-joining DNA ligase [Aurantimonas endophytica]|uniref:DNA ligase (ATP) n=1 Tax=Aurantimonas endophytica TaxID=1522175 RepID=A0A7W6MMV3_9HYPH|nr:non-homologous end-joining DNA ligase [Aurantimonas endophytica]MBB4001250.1 bifunctional non-homologous end joining protein LigD [Aurantimonas endophytica]MCO6403101.1 ATP-dependent DNA ligase [Aurantimonas endophytica]